MRALALALALLAVVTAQSGPTMLHPDILTPKSFTVLRRSGNSTLHSIDLGPAPGAGSEGRGDYVVPPLLAQLRGSRSQIGYDYAAMLHAESSDTLNTFISKLFPKHTEQELILHFIDYLWSHFLSKHTPEGFLEELEGMKKYHEESGSGSGETPSDVVASRFYTLANMPADPVNIIAMLEQEEEKNWPEWLKKTVNEIIKLLERLVHSCDAFGVWGDRTLGAKLYSSRNLDYNSDTGINRHKLVTIYNIEDDPSVVGTYATMGFAFGLGALAGMSDVGVTVSEMNLDNSEVTFDGLAFPLRLRLVLEQSTDLASALKVWHATNNTNSFNFLIGSAKDALAGNNAAVALETIMGYTGEFPANSSVEAEAVVNCSTAESCHKWTNETGIVHIGRPLPNAVWRSNHGMNPRVMATQEPLFNNSVFRYNLLHELISDLESAKIVVNETVAVGIVATLGTKGANYLTCEQDLTGDNVMSIAYAPGVAGKFYVAWESGNGTGWHPAACSPYVEIELKPWTPPPPPPAL